MATRSVEPKCLAKDTTILVGTSDWFDRRGSVHSGRFVRNQVRRPEGSSLCPKLWNHALSATLVPVIKLLDYDWLLHPLYFDGGNEHCPQDDVWFEYRIHRSFALLKVIFFPLYLPILCCHCCRGPAYTTYIPSPPVFHVLSNPWFEPQNSFGDGWMWYHMGKEQGRREAYDYQYHSTPVYGSNDNYSSSHDPSKHESTSYASTSRR